MRITPERMREFQEAYRNDFGEAIGEAEAQEMLCRLVTLYRVLLRPLPPTEEQDEEHS